MVLRAVRLAKHFSKEQFKVNRISHLLITQKTFVRCNNFSNFELIQGILNIHVQLIMTVKLIKDVGKLVKLVGSESA